MAHGGLQALGLALALLGWFGLLAATALPHWEVLSLAAGSIITAVSTYQGLWMAEGRGPGPGPGPGPERGSAGSACGPAPPSSRRAAAQRGDVSKRRPALVPYGDVTKRRQPIDVAALC